MYNNIQPIEIIGVYIKMITGTRLFKTNKTICTQTN